MIEIFMIDLNLRDALPKDALNIARLWIQCTFEVARLEPVYTPAIDEENLAGILEEELVSSKRIGWVAMHKDQLAGYVTCRIEAELPIFVERRYLYIIDLDVSPNFRGCGLSRMLMNSVETFARDNGIYRLELAYVTEDPRPQKVWTRHGFKPYFVHAFKTLD
jgi:GNAT superfamily N-acetyltransferase